MQLEHILNGQCMCCDADLSCIDYDHCVSQKEVGYTFKLDGKTVSLNQIRELLKIDAPKPVESTTRKVRSIRCINNDKVYRTMSEAGKDLGIDSAQISYSLKVDRPTKGYSFEFVE